MATAATTFPPLGERRLVRLRAGVATETRPVRVDRAGLGALRGLAVISEGEAKGHGFGIDGTTVEQVTAALDGAKGRWTHPNLCADGLGHYLGRWRNPRVEGGQAVADFEFSQAAHQFRPQGLDVSAAEYLLQRGEEIQGGEERADVLGVSVVAAFDLAEGEGDDEDQRVARLSDPGLLKAADFVDEPAANEGLFADGLSATASNATSYLNRVASEYGEQRVSAFLSAWLAGRDSTVTETKTPKPEAAKPAEETSAVQRLQAELAEKDGRVEALEATVKALQEAQAARKAKDDEAYVASLKARAAEFQSPIPEEDLERVRARLSAGDDETARLLGDAYLQVAEAKRQTPYSHTGADATVRLSTGGDPAQDVQDFLAKNYPNLKRGA